MRKKTFVVALTCVNIAALVMMGISGVLLNLSNTFVQAQVEGPRWGGTAITETYGTITQFYQTITSNPAFYSNYLFLNQLVATATGSVATPGVDYLNLAYKWDVTPDARNWTFYLYNNITWHDDVPFTSADVKFTYEYIVNFPLRGKGQFTNIDNIQTPDNYTVVFNLKKSNAAFIYNVGDWSGQSFILPMHLFANPDGSYKDWATVDAIHAPVGTGPFKFDKHVEGDYVRFVANEKYFKGRPYLDAVIIRESPDPAVTLELLETGQIDLLSQMTIPASEVARLNALGTVDILTTPICGGNIWLLSMDQTHAPFNDVRVRQAIAYAIDKNEIDQLVFKGLSNVPKYAYTDKIAWACDKSALLPVRNTTYAEELLDAAGYPRGQGGIRFSINSIMADWNVKTVSDITATIKSELAQVGIQMDTQVYAWALFLDKLTARHDWDLATHLYYQVPDPSVMSAWLTPTGTSYWSPGYNNTELNDLFVQGVSTANQTQRAQIYFQIEQIMVRDMPYVEFIDENRIYGRSKEFRGTFFDADQRAFSPPYDLSRAWWIKGNLTAPTSGGTSTGSITVPYEVYIGVIAAVVIIIVGAGGFYLYRKRKR